MNEFETATLVFQKATTEFQQATVAFQNATVEFQNKALELQEKALGLQEIAIYADVGVGLLHAALIGAGLWMMHRASSDRNKLMDEDRGRADKRHQEAKDWHEQVMNDGRTRHEEAMNESRTRHEESMTALKELIARTAPPSPPAASPAG